jgi:hypothetical protein
MNKYGSKSYTRKMIYKKTLSLIKKMSGMILKKLLNKIKSTITNSSENKAQWIFSPFVKIFCAN